MTNKAVPFIQEKLSRVPEKPGVYLFRDGHEKVLYVGKAKELRKRLRSYFRKSSAPDERKTAMVGEVRDFEYTVTANELEAFVLEANLIKQYRPRYNILLRDDKSYPYLRLTLQEEWPYLEVVRRIRKDGSKYFGPYVPAGAMWEILSFIRNNFPLRTCTNSLEKRRRPCIQYQIKKCTAPCDGAIDHREYMKMINEVRLLLEGKNKRLRESLGKKMQRLSAEMKYEEAALVRDRIRAIQKISEVQKAVAPGLGDVDVLGMFTGDNSAVFKILFIRNGIMIGSRHFFVRGVSGQPEEYLIKNFIGQLYGKEIIPPSEVLCPSMPEDAEILASWLSGKKGARVKIFVPQRGRKRKLVEMAEENAKIVALAEKGSEQGAPLAAEVASFLGLKKVPEDIGAFDISTISGRESVGAFVYWAGGEFRKEKYRHIRMDAVKGPDDYSMMREMVRRTIESLAGELPDLIIIDGGRAHLDAAREVFSEHSLADRDIVAVAKDPDRVFLAHERNPLGLGDGGAASLLLRRIRDEAHRFAITYHKKLRAKRVFESPLEKIPGVAKKRRFELLRHFGSIDAIKKAGIEEISQLKGFNKKVAGKILESLSDNGKG
jgi:excinuclease ABC subunit C